MRNITTTKIGDKITIEYDFCGGFKRRQIEATAKQPDNFEVCGFEIGDKVTYTNDCGVKFGPYKILAFEGNSKNIIRDKFIYINFDCIWCAVSPKNLKLIK